MDYAGEYELLFGVASLNDAAVPAVHQLQQEFPERSIRLVECPLNLGTNGKISTLTQLIEHASYDYLLINDSDITVSPAYLSQILSGFAPKLAVGVDRQEKAQPAETGMVTALYRGRAHGTLPSMLEALGIATDFQAGVLLSHKLEGGLSYGLGSTLCVSRKALDAIGGIRVLVDQLADDYEMGVRIHRAGFHVELSTEVVETSVPAYNWRGFIDHQLRWSRTVRDARPGGYFGLIFTLGLAWAVLNLLLSGFRLSSLELFGVSLCLRAWLAMTVGNDALGDEQILPNLWLLPLRDVIHLGVWIGGFCGSTIVWRGQHFRLHKGKLYAK